MNLLLLVMIRFILKIVILLKVWLAQVNRMIISQQITNDASTTSSDEEAQIPSQRFHFQGNFLFQGNFDL